MRSPSIRAATLSDVDRLVALETDSFGSDRLSARSFRRLIRSASAACRVIRDGVEVLGYYILLFRAGTGVARLYSIAVDPRHRGRGLAAALLADAEAETRDRGRERLHLEVREDNPAAIRLYERLGYTLKRRCPGYYADGGDGRRYLKRLAGSLAGGQDSDA
ncbi:MAG TPA: N-acetyltransferase [Bauldia sp.]|nr:N-acetyltransferase [Bauldia sp.]